MSIVVDGVGVWMARWVHMVHIHVLCILLEYLSHMY